MTNYEYLEMMERRAWQTAAKLTDPVIKKVHEDVARAYRDRILSLSLREAGSPAAKITEPTVRFLIP